MGNQPSLEGAAAQAPRPIQRLLRPNNALGLSKAELDKRCQPSGLYASCDWDEKTIRRLIGDGKIASRLKGHEYRQSHEMECPICFLHYSSINETKCCQAKICTECFLQIRPQKEKCSTCPFCNAPKLQVAIAQELDDAAIVEREKEEQRAIEAEIRSRNQRLHSFDDHSNTGKGTAARGVAMLSSNSSSTATSAEEEDEAFACHPLSSSITATMDPAVAFGASLEQQQQQRLLRARSGSVASESSSSATPSGSVISENNNNNNASTSLLAAVAMTPQERMRLEQELRSQQHSHPLTQQLQAEEEERRLRNDISYYEAQSTRLQEMRNRRELLMQSLMRNNSNMTSSSDSASSSSLFGRHSQSTNSIGRQLNGRDWNQIVEAIDNRGSGNRSIQSLDDLVILEAAIMLSMGEEARQQQQQSSSNSSGVSSTPMSLLDASAQASQQGFPLARRTLLSGSSSAGRGVAANHPSGSNSGNGNAAEEGMTTHLQSLLRTLQQQNSVNTAPSSPSLLSTTRRSRRNRNSSNNHRDFSLSNSILGNETTLSTAAMLLRGITEEEQMAMAIAASLADAGPPTLSSSSSAHNNESTSLVEMEENDPEEMENTELGSESSDSEDVCQNPPPHPSNPHPPVDVDSTLTDSTAFLLPPSEMDHSVQSTVEDGSSHHNEEVFEHENDSEHSHSL